jgi:hypothetical protein
MKSVRPTPVWLACILLAALLLVTVGATATLGRPFTGYFDVSGVQAQGDVVQLKLHLKMFNHGDEDVKGVIVTLMDSTPLRPLRGNFQPVTTWKSHKFIQMNQQFTVSKRDYEQWISSGRPDLVILFQDLNGKSWQKGVEISRSPLAR